MGMRSRQYVSILPFVLWYPKRKLVIPRSSVLTNVVLVYMLSFVSPITAQVPSLLNRSCIVEMKSLLTMTALRVDPCLPTKMKDLYKDIDIRCIFGLLLFDHSVPFTTTYAFFLADFFVLGLRVRVRDFSCGIAVPR